MANILISALTPVTTVVPASDVVPIINGGTTKQATIDQIVSKSLNAGGIVVDANINGVTVGMGLASLVSNTALGRIALSNNTTGINNTAIGQQSLRVNTTGNSNTGCGVNTLVANITGTQNTAVGAGVMQQHIGSDNNTGIGAFALYSNTKGGSNTGCGAFALFANTSTVATFAWVGGSGYTPTTGTSTYNSVQLTYVSGSTATTYPLANITVTNGAVTNVVVTSATNGSYGGVGFKDITTVMTCASSLIGGTGAGFSVTPATFSHGSGNIAIGVNALYNNTTGVNNVAIGTNALQLNAVGSSNIAVGFNALVNNIAINNVGIGYYSLNANTTGGGNVAVGIQASQSNTTGTNNAAVGAYALNNNVTGGQNAAFGSNALQSNTASYNTGIGYHALFNNISAGSNTAVGAAALELNVVGTGLVAVGFQALQNNTAINNTAVGNTALQNNTTGQYNTAVGNISMTANIRGSNNTAIGMQSLTTNTTGSQNTALGLAASFLNTTGSNNVAIGWAALRNNTVGIQNIAIGTSTLTEVLPTSKAITAFADYSGTFVGTVKATSVAHGLTGTTTKTISGTVNYDGVYPITVIDVDNFYFTRGWVATETGWWGIAAEGINNTAVGYNTGRGIVTGAGNTIIGANVSGLAAALTNNIIIANGAGTIKLQSDATNTTISENVIVTGNLYTKSPTPTALSIAGATTLTIAQLLTNIITVTQTAAEGLTLPTGALTDAGITSMPVNAAFDWNIINLVNSSGAIIMAPAATGHTYVGNTTIAIATSAHFRTQKIAGATFITYRVA